MVLKKRHSHYIEEDGPKKRRKEEVREEPKENKKKSKKGKEFPVKVVEKRLSDDDDDYDEDDPEEEENNVVEEDSNDAPEDPDKYVNEEIGWPKEDMIELFNKIEATLPRNDILSHSTQADRLDWGQVAFNNYSPSECKRVWTEIHKRIRHFRILKEILDDARIWVHQPWTNFYRGSRTIKHPDMPRRPPSTYLLYFKAKRDKVAAQRPDLDMTQISTIVAEMYHALSDSKRAKYVKMSEDLRKEYEEKRRLFFEQHPQYEQDAKLVKQVTSNKRAPKNLPAGLPKPRSAKQIFIDDREEKLKNEPNFDKTEVRNMARQQWESLSEKKRLVWINWAVEEENKYLEKMKLYKADNPEFELPKMKTVLNKKELLLRDRAVGKPPKPPNSGYSLYSKVMLAKCADLRPLLPKDRMKEISVRWNKLSVEEQEEYKNKVKYEQEQYKLNYATYLESLPEEERKEELLKTQKVKSVRNNKVVEEVNNGRNAKSKSKKSNKKHGVSVKKVERQYFPGEPHQPPVNAYDLFVESFVSDTKLSASEAPRFWEMLPSTDKAKFTRKLTELKEKYIRDYKKFLKSLDEEEVAKYNDLQKRNKEREAAAEAEKAQRSDGDDDSDEVSSSEDEVDDTVNIKKTTMNVSDSDENNETENRKSDSSSDSSSSSSESSSGSSSSEDSDSSSDDSDDDDEKNTTQVTVKKEESDSDSSDD